MLPNPTTMQPPIGAPRFRFHWSWSLRRLRLIVNPLGWQEEYDEQMPVLWIIKLWFGMSA